MATIGHAELDEHDRVLLSIAERAGAVELRPGGPRGLLARPTGQGSPRLAWAAIKAAKDRGWESYRSIERYMSGDSLCRRRQILDHFGDPSPAAPAGRCCDVCDPDPALARALLATPAAAARRRSPASRWDARADEPIAARRGATAERAGDPAPGGPAEPVDEHEFERLRQWRWSRAEGKPAYTVAANAALEGILRRRPATIDELLAVHGIGPTFCERHGESLLEAIAELRGTADAPGAAIASVPAPT